MGNVIGAANEASKHTGLAVNPWDLETTPHANDRSGPTTSSLAKMIEASNLMPNIKRWSTGDFAHGCGVAAFRGSDDDGVADLTDGAAGVTTHHRRG